MTGIARILADAAGQIRIHLETNPSLYADHVEDIDALRMSMDMLALEIEPEEVE